MQSRHRTCCCMRVTVRVHDPSHDNMMIFAHVVQTSTRHSEPDEVVQTKLCASLQSAFGEALKGVQQVGAVDTSATLASVDAHLDMLRPAISNYGGSIVVRGICRLMLCTDHPSAALPSVIAHLSGLHPATGKRAALLWCLSKHVRSLV